MFHKPLTSNGVLGGVKSLCFLESTLLPFFQLFLRHNSEAIVGLAKS